MGEYLYRLQRHFSFNKDELSTLVLIALAFGFSLSFRDWGGIEFDYKMGAFNFINTSLIVFLSVVAHECGHKLWALHRGYTAQLRPWKLGILITLFLAFLSNGYLPFLAYSGVYIYHLKLERLGRFRYYTNLSEHATISMMGPMANMLLALLFKVLMPLNPYWMHQAMVINLLLALMNMIPIPPFDGADIFYWSTLRFAFSIVFFGTLAFLLYATDMVWDAVWIAALIGAVGWFIFGAKIGKEFFDPDGKG